MIGTVSLLLVSLCTPIPHSLALGQRLSPTSLSSAYLIPIPSCYCLGTYLAPRGQRLLFVLFLLSLGRYCLLAALLSSSMLIGYCYCLALSEAQIESAIVLIYDST